MCSTASHRLKTVQTVSSFKFGVLYLKKDSLWSSTNDSRYPTVLCVFLGVGVGARARAGAGLLLMPIRIYFSDWDRKGLNFPLITLMPSSN